MNPTMPSRITPEIAEALMRRRMGGVGGGNTAPAQQQVMAPNGLGGPTGVSQTPLATSPQPMPSGNMPAMSQPAPSQGGQSAGSQSTGTGNDPNKVLMKALLQRLVADL